MFLIFIAYRFLIRAVLAGEKHASDLALAIMVALSFFMFIVFFELVFSHPFEALLCFLLAFVQLLIGARRVVKNGKN